MAQILDGKVVRDKIAEELSTQISHLRQGYGGQAKPKLVIIQIGDLPESNTYIAQKIKFGEKIGAIVQHKHFDADISQKALIDELLIMNHEPSTHGIIIQLPFPKHFDPDTVIDTIDPQKDVDGLTSFNLKKLWENKPEAIIPATTKGILTLLDYYKIPIESKHVIVVGRSSLVGKPTALSFLNRDATVTICHKKTQYLAQITKTADILVVAAGKPRLITKDHVTKGQVVVDVGINVLDYSSSEAPAKSRSLKVSSSLDFARDKLARTITNSIVKPETEPPARKLIGDVDFDQVSRIVGAITPVPGGCGPMTVASLFQNLLEAYTRPT